MPMAIEEALMGKEFEHRRAKVFYSKRRSIIIERAIALLNRLRTSIRGLPYGGSGGGTRHTCPGLGTYTLMAILVLEFSNGAGGTIFERFLHKN